MGTASMGVLTRYAKACPIVQSSEKRSCFRLHVGMIVHECLEADSFVTYVFSPAMRSLDKTIFSHIGNNFHANLQMSSPCDRLSHRAHSHRAQESLCPKERNFTYRTPFLRTCIKCKSQPRVKSPLLGTLLKVKASPVWTSL